MFSAEILDRVSFIINGNLCRNASLHKFTTVKECEAYADGIGVTVLLKIGNTSHVFTNHV